ncbi:MAG: sugar transferase, partial [Flavobacteriaceae bacterium]|nr:sugar transferase [Flavobacteriaceae bacterium]
MLNYRFLIKPVLDFLLALLGLILIIPLLLPILIYLYAEHKASPIFIQKRAGYKGKIFNIYKLRTLNENKDKEGKFCSLDERVTKFGRFLRKYSIDELPQLVNVLKGEMSLIGPRPLLTSYLGEYDSKQFRRHEVKPGISGWAQVNGRNGISWGKKFELDVWYVDNLSFFLDIKILMLTIVQVVFPKKGKDTSSVNVPNFKHPKKERKPLV